VRFGLNCPLLVHFEGLVDTGFTELDVAIALGPPFVVLVEVAGLNIAECKL